MLLRLHSFMFLSCLVMFIVVLQMFHKNLRGNLVGAKKTAEMRKTNAQNTSKKKQNSPKNIKQQQKK